MIGVGTFRITPRARDYVNDVLTSERLSYGPYMQRFESFFARVHDCRFAVMTNSGTSSLLVALAALKNKYGWKDGDEVLVPAVTFIATSNIVLQLNLKPVFVDVDPIFYELDPSKLEAAITPRTRCMIPVHLFGLPCDMTSLGQFARDHELKVMEDSCETMFAKHEGRSVGSLGEIGCFSTYIAHLLTTGVGGLCTTNDTDLAIALRSLINHGRDSIYLSIDDDLNTTKDQLRMIVARRFSFVTMGYSFRATELEGAIGLAQLEDYESMIRKRRENAAYLISELQDLEDQIQLPSLRKNSDHSFMMFPIVLRDQKKTELVNHLELNGVETRDMLPLTNQPFYREQLGLREDDYPIAKWINESGFYIGCHQDLSQIEKEYMVDVIHGFFRKKLAAPEKACLIFVTRSRTDSSRSIIEALRDLNFDEYILVELGGATDLGNIFQGGSFKTVTGSGSELGAALQRAIALAESENVILMGVDGFDDPKDVDKILIQLKHGDGLVIGSRFLPGGGRETTRFLSYRSLGNRFFSFLLSVVLARNVTDCNNIFRGFKKSMLGRLTLQERGESFLFEMTLKALNQGVTLSEIPTREKVGFARTKKDFHRLMTGFSFLRILGKHLGNPSSWRVRKESQG